MPLLLLQANQALPEVTVGGVVATLILLGTCLVSVGMILVWISRINQDGHALPLAKREALTVGPGLLMAALIVAAAMAALVLVPDPPDAANAKVANAANAAAAGPGELVERPKDESADVESTDVESTDAASRESAEGSDEGTAAEDEAAAGAKKANALSSRQKFIQMFLANLMVSLMIGGGFGLAVWIGQRGRSRAFRGEDANQQRQEESDRRGWDEPGRGEDSPAISHRPFGHGGPQDPIFDADSYPVPSAHNEDDPDPPGEVAPWEFVPEFRFAAETFLAAYVPTVILKVLLAYMLPESKSHPFLEMIRDGIDPVMILGLGFMAVIVAPLTEELLYRVTIFGGLAQQRMHMVGMIVSSVIFAFAHGFPDSIALLPLAFVLAYTYSRRRSYRTVVLVHFLFNLFNMVLAVLPML